MKNKKLLLGLGALAIVLVAGFLASGNSLQGATRNTVSTPSTPTVLTFAQASDPVTGGEIIAGEQTASTAVLVARYQVTATGTNSSKVTITNLILENDYNEQNPLANDAAISQVILNFPTSYRYPNNLNGTRTATIDSEGYVSFTGLNFQIPSNTPTRFEVKVVTSTISGNVKEGDQIELDFSPKEYTAVDRANITINGAVEPDGIDAPEFTLVAPAPVEPTPIGTITMASTWVNNTNIVLNSNPSVVGNLLTSGNLTGFNNLDQIAVYSISPTQGERFIVDTITFENDSLNDNPLANDGALQSVYIEYHASTASGQAIYGPNTIRQGTYSNGQLTFTGLNNLWTPTVNDSTGNLYILGLFNPIGQGSNAGDQIEIDFPMDGTFHAVGQTSGAVLTQPNGNTTDVDGLNRTIVAEVATPTVDLRVNGMDGPVSSEGPTNASLILSWTSTNATSCTASSNPYRAAWVMISNKPLNGTESIYINYGTEIYTLTCSGPGGSASDSVVFNGPTPPP